MPTTKSRKRDLACSSSIGLSVGTSITGPRSNNSNTVQIIKLSNDADEY